jgi:YaiO family outer membrane protein
VLLVFVSALLITNPSYSQSDSTENVPPASSGSWSAFVGGEWDFIRNDGPPLNGKDWQEAHWGVGYSKPRNFALTFSHRIVGRTDPWDQIFSLEGYKDLPAGFSFRALAAGSPDHDFVYRLRAEAEIDAKILRKLHAGVGYWFINYNTTDIHAITPFIGWYAKDWEFEFRYLNILDTDADRRFNIWSFRVSDVIEERWLRPFAGIVSGGRIFGILTPQEAPTQRGYLAYGGNVFGLTKRLDLSVFGSYAHEEPAFSYVGVGSDLKMRF